MLGSKENISNLENVEILQIALSDHNAITPEIIGKIENQRNPFVWKFITFL